MNIIRKMILFIKSIFIKQNEIKKLPEAKIIVNKEEREHFLEALKITTIPKITKKSVETLICTGDGLGIQKKITG